MESDKPGIDCEFYESVSVRNYLMEVFDKDNYRNYELEQRGQYLRLEAGMGWEHFAKRQPLLDQVGAYLAAVCRVGSAPKNERIARIGVKISRHLNLIQN
jgi:hypothetical protein